MADHLINHGLLNIHSSLSLGRQLIGAVSHVASLQLVHRDIKPENILFREGSLDPVLTDFGIVRDLQAESITQSWQPRGPGTYLFSSPEQLNNTKTLIDWRSDQFSLGILLSICTFDIHPYEHNDPVPNEIIKNMASRGLCQQGFLTLQKHRDCTHSSEWSRDGQHNDIERQLIYPKAGICKEKANYDCLSPDGTPI